MVHGIDERITIESLRAGLRGMHELVYKLRRNRARAVEQPGDRFRFDFARSRR